MSLLPPPLRRELVPAPSIEQALQAFAEWPQLILFDSARLQRGRGRYSYLSADPRQSWQMAVPRLGYDPLTALRAALPVGELIPDLPPFQGGIAGLLGYECGQSWERYPIATRNEFELPAMSAGLYDWVLAWDGLTRRCWLIAQHWHDKGDRATSSAAQDRMQMVLAQLEQPRPLPEQWSPTGTRHIAPDVAFPVTISAGQSGSHALSSSFSAAGYQAAVAQAIEYIRAGDIFQVNLAQRLLSPTREHPLRIYLRLRKGNPAPFAGYYQRDDWAIASASPERFIQVQGSRVETRPIKGTRQRMKSAPLDLMVGDELRESEKDRAENVMIVDLMRNDLSRVCQPGSVRVPQLCQLETYETVQHLVSVIQGTLRDGQTPWDLLQATLPGGSITGAPKVRAMEIIAELEPTVRGPYTGNLFYAGVGGVFDSSILIRSFLWRHGWLQCSVGAGIVAQSDPTAEYQETLVKGAGMLAALTP